MNITANIDKCAKKGTYIIVFLQIKMYRSGSTRILGYDALEALHHDGGIATRQFFSANTVIYYTCI